MAIERSLFTPPEGMEDIGGATEAVEIELETPEIALLDDGSAEITLVEEVTDLTTAPFDANLAEYMDDGQLTAMSTELVACVQTDINSRREWADTFVKGLEVLGFNYENRTEPWEDACGVYSTVLAEAAIRFQAEAMSETFPAAGPVKTKILGEITQDKEDAALRVKTDMNYELTDVMVEYRPEHERLLYSLGLAGSAFKKIYFDPSFDRQVALYIPAEDMIVPYGASNLETAERVTHVMRKTKNEMAKLQAAGFYRNVELGDPVTFFTDIEEEKAKEGGFSLSSDDRYTLYEIHADVVLDEIDNEGGVEPRGMGLARGEDRNAGEDPQLAKPYVITIEQGTGTVLAVRRNWNPDDPLTLKRHHFVHYVYVPGFGFYGLGLIHIIGGYARAGTSIIRQLVDAGTLSNLPGGLKSRGLRVKGDDTPIGPGEFRDVDVPSGSIRENILPLPYKEPSQTLLALLDKITEEGRRLGAISEMNISDMSANAPVGTTLALLERTLKPMAAVQSRVHYAMKQEFKLLRAIMAEYAPVEYEYMPDRGEPRARQADYATVEVIPVSDPNSSTMAQRVVQYQTVMQMAQAAPQIYDLPQLHRQMIEVLGIKNADKLVPTDDDNKPVDPVSENMNVLTGVPLQAFITQDHQAHITTHDAFLTDPQMAAFIGQNPRANEIMGAMQAHLGEHMGFLYRQQIETNLGAPLPPPNEEYVEVLENSIASLQAQAAIQLNKEKQAQAAQQQAQQIAEDPLVQMQQRELQLEMDDQERLVTKDAGELALKQRRLALDEEKAKVDAVLEAQRIASQNEQAQAKNDLAEAKAIVDATKERAEAHKDASEAYRDDREDR
jgi:hypothetical protein|tara:strand:- start:4312 stop:6825 length:2514 start_codon:yes stop_codon:yes gene_type:complete